jgi:hypothetical protein
MAAAGADDPTAQLFAWVESQGGSAANVVACQTPFGLGLLAARPMKKGDAAVRVPESCLLSALPEAAAPALAALQAEVPADFWAGRLGLALLAERAKGEGSRVSEYVVTLPAAFTAPLFWSPEAVGLLSYPTARARLLKTAKFVASFGKEQLASDAATEAFGGVAVGADALGWAVAACSSRAYAVSGGARVLCPIIDLGNHAPKGEASCEVRGTPGTPAPRPPPPLPPFFPPLPLPPRTPILHLAPDEVRGTAGGAIALVALRSIAAGEEVCAALPSYHPYQARHRYGRGGELLLRGAPV